MTLRRPDGTPLRYTPEQAARGEEFYGGVNPVSQPKTWRWLWVHGWRWPLALLIAFALGALIA